MSTTTLFLNPVKQAQIILRITIIDAKAMELIPSF